ncbi:hypothetical protein HNR33_000511 [Brassicibacter mesophilus]
MIRYDYENWKLHDVKLIKIDYIGDIFEVSI